MNNNFNVIADATIESPVGIYKAKLSGGESDYYSFSYNEDGILEIIPTNLTVKAKNVDRYYYSSNPQFNYEFKGIKFEKDKQLLPTPIFNCDADILSPCGTYEIQIHGEQMPNYNVTYENGILTINPRDLYVRPLDCTKKYGEDNPKFQYTLSGFVNNENESVLGNDSPIRIYTYATKYSSVGSYELYVSNNTIGNYKITRETKAYLTIEQVEQYITWDQQFDNCVVGDQIPLKAEISSGLEIQYISGDESIASIYRVGNSPYLDCIKEGTVVVRATHEGDKNHLPTVRVSKVINILDHAGIDDVIVDKKKSNGPIYNLTGCPVEHTIKGHIYIQDGRKFIAE